jgi:hypothetical protein
MSLRSRKSVVSNEAFAASPSASGHSAGRELLRVDIAAAQRDEQLQQIERTLLRLAAETHG